MNVSFMCFEDETRVSAATPPLKVSRRLSKFSNTVEGPDARVKGVVALRLPRRVSSLQQLSDGSARTHTHAERDITVIITAITSERTNLPAPCRDKVQCKTHTHTHTRQALWVSKS